jgi:putative pyruvate formate lyase activating enzyme
MTLAKTPWYWETVTSNITLIAKWGEDFSIRHLVVPNHVECCTYPVLDWIAKHTPTTTVSMSWRGSSHSTLRPGSSKCSDKYTEIEAGRHHPS